jgi:hypothetical protein
MTIETFVGDQVIAVAGRVQFRWLKAVAAAGRVSRPLLHGQDGLR